MDPVYGTTHQISPRGSSVQMANQEESGDVELGDDVFDDSDREDILMIDESSPTKNKQDNAVQESNKNDHSAEEEKDADEDSEHSDESSDEDIENQDNSKSSPQANSPSTLKPIQAVLNRVKQPSNHSKQTRYQTRTRSCSLPSRQSRYSSTETPFAIDTKLNLVDLASKLTVANNKVNGCPSTEKRSPGRQGKSPPQVNKSTINSLKKKLAVFRSAEEESSNLTAVQLGLPTSLMDVEALANGTNHDGQTPGIGQSNRIVNVDLTQEGQKTTGGNVKYLDVDRIRTYRQNIKDAQKFKELQTKTRELECAKELEEHRAREQLKSEQAEAFHAKCLEYYDEALRVMSKLHDDPDDKELHTHLPSMEGGLPLWPLLSSTASKSIPGSTFTTAIENAITDSTPDRSRRKKTQAATTETGDIADKDCNVNSGGLDVPNHITEEEEHAIECLAVNYALRAKTPKFAKRAFEAAKYAAESGIRNVLQAEVVRKGKEARGFGLPARSNVSKNKQFVNISPMPANSRSMLIPVPVSLIPVQFTPGFAPASKPAQLKLVNSVPTTSSTGIAKVAISSTKPGTTGAVKSRTDSPVPQQSEKDPKRRFKCPECEYTTDNRSHLRRHVVTVHSDIKPFKCYVCDKDFARGEKCKYHIEKEHPEVLYDPKKTKRQHVKLAEDGVQWPLTVSTIEVEENTNDSTNTNDETNSEGSTEKNGNTKDSAVKEEAAQQNNQLLQTTQVFSCQHCTFNARNIPQLQKHLAEVHSAVRRLKCGVCHYSSSRKHKMIMHMRKHGELFCFHCDFSTMASQLFYMHLRLCSKQHHSQVLTCPLCHRVYTTRDQLQTHTSEEHDASELFFCDMCSYCNTDFDEFEKHSEKHFSGDVDSQCMKCNEVFSDTNELVTHSKDCTGATSENAKLKCPMCTVFTNQPALLREHLNTHTKEPVIPCIMDGCKFSARWDSTIDQHMMLKHKIPKLKAAANGPKKKEKAETPTAEAKGSLVKSPTKPQPSLLKSPPSLFKAQSVRKPQPAVIKTQPSGFNAPPTVVNSQPLILQPAMLNPTVPTLQSPTIIQSPLNLSNVALSGLPLTLPLNAVPIFSNNPISMQNITMIPTQQTNLLTTTATKTKKSKHSRSPMPLAPTSKYRILNPEESATTPMATAVSSSAAVYDQDTGGIQGHGSGMFTCPRCPDRMPFKYRRSYEKHMYKHQKTGKVLQPPTTVFKIKCPVKYCRAAFDTNEQVETHLERFHGISKPDAGTLKIDPEPVLVESDEEKSENEEEPMEVEEVNVSDLVINDVNGEILFKDENGDVELDLDLNGEENKEGEGEEEQGEGEEEQGEGEEEQEGEGEEEQEGEGEEEQEGQGEVEQEGEGEEEQEGEGEEEQERVGEEEQEGEGGNEQGEESSSSDSSSSGESGSSDDSESEEENSGSEQGE